MTQHFERFVAKRDDLFAAPLDDTLRVRVKMTLFVALDQRRSVMHRRTIRGLALVILIFAAVLCLTSAFAQTPKAPKVGSKPSVQITPKGSDRLQTCRNGQGYEAMGR
jgi:hypothetical protein